MIKKGNLILSLHDNLLVKQNEFFDKLTDLMHKMNPSLKWESSTYPEGRYIMLGEPPESPTPKTVVKPIDPLSFKFRMSRGYDLATILSYPFIPEKIDVYEHGKQGLNLSIISNKKAMNFTIMVACKEYFHRDWEHNGVCIETTKKHPMTDTEETDAAEREEERRHDRAIKRHQDYAESGGEW
jgi:hypothetical protein